MSSAPNQNLRMGKRPEFYHLSPTAGRLDIMPEFNRDAVLKRRRSGVRLQRQSRNGW
jgi:hypothetical protein